MPALTNRGRCLNRDYCALAAAREVQLLSENCRTCAECGHALLAMPPTATRRGMARPIARAAALLLLLAAFVIGYRLGSPGFAPVSPGSG